MATPPNDNNNNGGNDEFTDKTTVLDGVQETLRKELQKAKEQEACLIVIRGTPQGHRYFLTQKEMIAGRDNSVEIVLYDQGVSRKHAKFVKEGEIVRLIDLGSANGTFVNDRRVQVGDSIILSKEDMIKMGSSILKFLPQGQLEILFYGNLGSAAHTDALTKIYNRGYFTEAIEAEFKRSKALHSELSLIYFDLDHFKSINDTYGHDAGDYVLREITGLIRGSLLRPKDVFARIGGEEFVILALNTSAITAQEIAEKIRATVQTHAFIYDQKRLPVTISVGISEIRSDMESFQTLMKTADKALYAAKQGGRNRVVVAS